MQNEQERRIKFISALYLVICIASDVAAITCMKLSQGFTHWLPSVLIFIFYSISIFFLVIGLKYWELGRVYAIWSGMGTFLAFFIGVIFFKEVPTFLKIVSVTLIIMGVIGLRWA